MAAFPDVDETISAAYDRGVKYGVMSLADRVGLSKDANEQEVTSELEKQLKGMTPKQRRKRLKELRREINKRSRDIARDTAPLEARKAHLERLIESYTEFEKWLPPVLVLEKPNSGVSHHLRQDILDGTALVYSKGELPNPRDDYELEVFDLAHVFVVEHNWAAAFANATDYSDAMEFKLPAEVCLFEFKISGRAFVVAAADVDGVIFCELMARGGDGWLVIGIAERFSVDHEEKNTDGSVSPFSVLANFLYPQIKAICIALEAEVADTEVIRAPHKLNRAREKAGRTQLSDYHVISLTRRQHYLPHELPTGGEVKDIRRLHFRRGHWRHFETFKSWVRWTLVGNPDLGFIDKHYKL